MRILFRSMALSLIMAALPGSTAAQNNPQGTTATPQTPTAHSELPGMTLGQVMEMLRAGKTPQAITAQVRLSGSVFDLSLEDAIRLVKMGATPDLIQAMTRQSTPPATEQTPPPVTLPAAPVGTLTPKKIVKMHQKGMTPDEIAQEITAKGLKEPLELDQVLQLGAEGLPSSILIAMTTSGPPATSSEPAVPPAAGTETAEVAANAALPPLKTSEIRTMLETRQPSESIITAIETRGIEAPPSLVEAVELRKLGATDEIITAINDAALDLSAEDETQEEATEPSPSLASQVSALPPAVNDETLTVLSQPAGARVYLSPSRTRMQERFRHDYLVGRTPVMVTVPPGDYAIVVEKRAGTFEAGLLPAWRTMHDRAGIRSILDETELTFDPVKCCLPGSVSGNVELRPVPEDQPRAIIGDQFDGLPPYLFDGETLQILRVRHTMITETMKLYQVRKTAGQPRVLIATFVPSEGDPLELEPPSDVTPPATFDAELDQPALQYLGDDPGQRGLAEALGVETEHLAKAIPVLKRVGKVILHQQVPGGVRLMTLAIDYNGRLRATDQTIRPENPFAEEPVKKGKKKKPTPAPPPIPGLPTLERIVVPGLGTPHLSLVNTGPDPIALLFDDGEFCFAPSDATIECIIDPGTHQVRAMSGGEVKGGGQVHLSYHARYTMKVTPMPVR